MFTETGINSKRVAGFRVVLFTLNKDLFNFLPKILPLERFSGCCSSACGPKPKIVNSPRGRFEPSCVQTSWQLLNFALKREMRMENMISYSKICPFICRFRDHLPKNVFFRALHKKDLLGTNCEIKHDA